MTADGIDIAPGIFISEDELIENFIRSSGPGGQNVNKVATAVQLRFDARNAQGLPERVRERTITLAGQRATKDGVIVIEAARFRTQEQNRADARARLAALVAKATAQGLDPLTPAIAIARATRPDQQVIAAPIGELSERIAQANLSGPVLVMVGQVFGEQSAVHTKIKHPEQKAG